MKLKGITLIAALSFAATSGLMAKPQAKDKVPGVAAQPVSYFYTGKPYDADLGAYTFQYRNYDPELKRWTSSDPSGFPDWANNQLYAPVPTAEFDPTGLAAYVINNLADALIYWKRNFGFASDNDVASLSDDLVKSYSNAPGFINLIADMKTKRIEPALLNVSKDLWSGWFNGGYPRRAGIGPVNQVVGRSNVSYTDETYWYAKTDWMNNARELQGLTYMYVTSVDRWDFSINPNDTIDGNIKNEIIPGMIAGWGTPFTIVVEFQYEFTTDVIQPE